MRPTKIAPSPVARLVPLVALAGTMGCVLLQPPLTSPAHGGGTWRALTSPHFEVKTDLPRSDALEALGSLERTYDLFANVAFRGEHVGSGRVHIVLFRREKDYRVLGLEGSDAYFTQMLDNDPEPEPTAVMFGGLSDRNRLVFQHELTHYFVRRALAHVPVWLTEGMAEYYSTLQAEDGEVILGRVLPSVFFTTATDWLYAPPGARYYAIPVSAVPSVRELLIAPPEVFYAARFSSEEEPTRDDLRRERAFYAGAWALVHLLMNGKAAYRESFAAYLHRLASGTKPEAAWDESFPELDLHTLQRDFAAHLLPQPRIVRVKSYTPRPPPPAEGERTLSDAEVHVLWARLIDWHGEGVERARKQLDEALESDPASVDVPFWRGRFFLARGDYATAESELLSAIDAKPREPPFLLTWLQLEWKKADLGKASRGAMEIASSRLADVAHTAAELDAVARARAWLGRPDDALPFAEQALQVEPSCWRCFDTYAILLSVNGRYQEAVTAEARALELLPEENRAAPLLTRLRKLEAAARAKARPAPPSP